MGGICCGGSRDAGADRKRTFKGALTRTHDDGTTIESLYDFDRDTTIGKGASGAVVVGTRVGGEKQFAIKLIDRTASKRALGQFEQEISILSTLDHPNIVRLFESFRDSKTLYCVMELCSGGHLGRVLSRRPQRFFDEVTAANYVAQIAGAIAFCHSQGVMHRDLKLENVLLENKGPNAQLKLIDFGVAAAFHPGERLTDLVGTTYSAAPQVFRQDYCEKADCWSLGVVAFILLCGEKPFQGVDVPNVTNGKEVGLMSAIMQGRYSFCQRRWSHVSATAIHFITCLLELDEARRPSAADALRHYWLGLAQQSKDPVKQDANSRSVLHRITRISSRAATKNELKQKSMMAVAFSIPQKDVSQVREYFQSLDKDHNGTVDFQEFRTSLAYLNPLMPESHIRTLFDCIDADGNGEISYLEFVAATMDPRQVDLADMRAAFAKLDADGKGYLTREDLLHILQQDEDEFHTGPSDVNATPTPSVHSKSPVAAAGLRLKNMASGIALSSRHTSPTQRSEGLPTHGSSTTAGGHMLGENTCTSTSAEADDQGSCPVGQGMQTAGKAPGSGAYSTRESETPMHTVEQFRVQEELERKVDAIMREADLDNDGKIDRAEWLWYMAEHTANSRHVTAMQRLKTVTCDDESSDAFAKPDVSLSTRWSLGRRRKDKKSRIRPQSSGSSSDKASADERYGAVGSRTTKPGSVLPLSVDTGHHSSDAEDGVEDGSGAEQGKLENVERQDSNEIYDTKDIGESHSTRTRSGDEGGVSGGSLGPGRPMHPGQAPPAGSGRHGRGGAPEQKDPPSRRTSNEEAEEKIRESAGAMRVAWAERALERGYSDSALGATQETSEKPKLQRQTSYSMARGSLFQQLVGPSPATPGTPESFISANGAGDSRSNSPATSHSFQHHPGQSAVRAVGSVSGQEQGLMYMGSQMSNATPSTPPATIREEVDDAEMSPTHKQHAVS